MLSFTCWPFASIHLADSSVKLQVILEIFQAQ